MSHKECSTTGELVATAHPWSISVDFSSVARYYHAALLKITGLFIFRSHLHLHAHTVHI